MTNPREQAIEKLEYIIRNYPYKVSDVNAGRGWHYRHIEVILDALNIEIVSKESESQEGDLVKYQDGFFSGFTQFYIATHFSQFVTEIIKINNKPAVYVENIGVKNGK